MYNKISQVKTAPIYPAFDANAATTYNIKSEQYYKNYEDDVKRIINTAAAWNSPEFAEAVWVWQQNNGLSGKWIDGKFGPVTMGKMAQSDSQLNQKYDAYTQWKEKHKNEEPNKRVVELKPEIERIKTELGAQDIPTALILGWIQVESAGKLNDLTTSAGIREAGLFQISDEEAKSIGADQDRIMRDQDYAITTGIQLIRHHEENVDRVLSKYSNIQQSMTKNTDMYWQLVMFSFSAGPGTMEKLITNMSHSNYVPNSWNDVMKFAAYNPAGYSHSPVKWSYHINRAMNIGNKAIGGTAMSKAVFIRIKQAKRKARSIRLKKMIE